MYKKALKIKLRVQTPKGSIGVEDLMKLSLRDLKATAENLNEKIKQTSSSDEALSFLDSSSNVDPVDALAFEIVKDIYLDKLKESNDAKTALEIKAHNEKIMKLIKQKEDEDLGKLSVEELKAQLK